VSALAVEHLRARLAELHQALRIAVAAQARAAAALTRPDLTPFCVTDEQVAALLDRVDAFTEAMTEPPSPARADPESEQQLRRLAAARGVTLPLDALATRYGLSRVEQDALLLVAAPELDPGYERVYAYVVDNLNRRAPCVELLVTVLGETPADRLALRRALGEAGRLRRYGLLRAYGEAPAEPSRELALGDGEFEYLMGWGGDVGTLGDDPGEVAPAAAPVHLTPARLTRLGQALRAGDVDVVGLWGLPADSQPDAAQALAAAAGRPLRRVTADVAHDLRTAAALGARVATVTDAEVDRAFDEGRILRTHVLRPTWHFVAPADARWLLELSAERVHRLQAAYDRRHGIEGAAATPVLDALAAAVAGGGHRTRAELADALEAAGFRPTPRGLRLRG